MVFQTLQSCILFVCIFTNVSLKIINIIFKNNNNSSYYYYCY